MKIALIVIFVSAFAVLEVFPALVLGAYFLLGEKRLVKALRWASRKGASE